MVRVANQDPRVLLISLEDPRFLDIVVALDVLQEVEGISAPVFKQQKFKEI